jgi:hypothetical protein
MPDTVAASTATVEMHSKAVVDFFPLLLGLHSRTLNGFMTTVKMLSKLSFPFGKKEAESRILRVNSFLLFFSSSEM